MTYKESLEYLHTHQWLGAVYGLATVSELLQRLGSPEKTLNIIHIAGTNGKGSTTASLASVLIESGYSVVSYTSPEVRTYLDRFRIQQAPVDEATFAAQLTRVAAVADAMEKEGHPHPTVFEMEFAVSLLIAEGLRPDFYLAETGMGGRLDATNAIEAPLLTIITTIAMDHQQYLGADLTAIAREKAGIIKANVPLLTWPHDADVSAVLREEALRHGAPYYELDAAAIVPGPIANGLQTFHYQGHPWATALLGPHQCENAAGVIASAFHLRQMGYKINNAQIESGLKKVVWPGRFEQIAEAPAVYLDGAHNPEAIGALMATLKTMRNKRKPIFILHVFADKDVEGIVRAITIPTKKIFCTSVNHPRSLTPDALANAVQRHLSEATVCTTHALKEAVQRAMTESHPDDLIVIFGSLSHLQEARVAVTEFSREDKHYDQF